MMVAQRLVQVAELAEHEAQRRVRLGEQRDDLDVVLDLNDAGTQQLTLLQRAPQLVARLGELSQLVVHHAVVMVQSAGEREQLLPVRVAPVELDALIGDGQCLPVPLQRRFERSWSARRG